ncbi:LPS export ABC transporter permease LptG [Aquicella lusitana]|uniref:Lipopolysaccharide export system permease protein n=1 Tax=Aquicella lusitana TaxID=254246 RepID=A0A370GG73_9COXI|nr:LPS export ABC transporter permease LptG [Aquicella lusitana]RDI42677.1 lipopolysaccharide export system permease protein [Aquicella lusitana]VVC73468.1 Lipopolysaccharide export system permease protein LptG [Aquicella lusitana]
MIKVLERYIAKTTIISTMLVALIITSILFLITLLGELKNIGEGDYSIAQAFFYVLMRLPNEFYHFSPMLLLLGSIVGLSILSSHRELAVMRAAGFSIRRIVYSVLLAALALVLAISIVGEWIAPSLSYKAEMHKESAKNGGQVVVTGAGVWFHVDNNFIHVQQVVGRQLLEGVTRYQFNDKHQLQAAYFAKKLSYRDNQWRMSDVVKTSFYPERTKSQLFTEAAWDLKFNSNLLNVGLVEPSDMSLPKLVKFARYLHQNGLQSSEYQYEFWQRIFQPFISLVMIFLAIPFVLGAFSTSTLGWRIVIGILVGFVFFISNAFLGQLCIVFQVPAVLAAFLPLAAFLVFGLFLFNRLVKR